MYSPTSVSAPSTVTFTAFCSNFSDTGGDFDAIKKLKIISHLYFLL